ncbi:MAG: putative porin [Gammaproteobacteria bacterium]|nr:putative porin [Gammaproteobacteria bacterium]
MRFSHHSLSLCVLVTFQVWSQQANSDDVVTMTTGSEQNAITSTMSTVNDAGGSPMVAVDDDKKEYETVAEAVIETVSETATNSGQQTEATNASDMPDESAQATPRDASLVAPEVAEVDPMQQPIPAINTEEQQAADSLVQQVLERAKQAQLDEEKSRPTVPEGSVRINYIPEFIREEIREQVRADLRADVVGDVLTQAKNERWGIPDALPAWVNKVSFKGDIRLRAQGDMFADGNVANTYVNLSEINASGGFYYAGPEAYLNTTEDRLRLRARARVGIDAKITQGVKAGFRLSTGNQKDPVSTNQTLGTYGNRYQVVWDQAYLKHDNYDLDAYHWLTLIGGRMPSPWVSTDLVWDSDLAFEGIAATYRRSLRDVDSLYDSDLNDRTLFMTIGAFPLQEVELTNKDKWLYGAQMGAEFIALNQSRFKIALAYYFFDNITGVRNKVVESSDYDYTAPAYMQKGNVLFNIRNSADPDAELWALAAQYHELNLTLLYDLANFSPLHVVLAADVVKNIGYDRTEIENTSLGVVERSQGWIESVGRTKERTLGYQLGVTVGWPRVTLPGNWNVSLFYKYLERDAVLDAMTDSDFHLGGTDAKGWILGGNYALEDNTWLSARWMTSDSIDGFSMGVDTVQVDINAKF